MKKIIIETKSEKILLSKYILSIFKNIPYSFLCKAFRNKDIRINGIKTSKDIYVKNNDVIDIYIDDSILFNLPKNISYYYNDDNIVIAYKPKGILSNNNEPSFEPSFDELVKKDLNNDNISLCHRLDRNTSGLLIFAKNIDSYNEMLKAFENNGIKKEYIAYVANSKFDKTSCVLEGYLIKDSNTGFSKVINENRKNSKKIITEYSVLYINKKLDYAKLNITLHTGKTHQIRAHLASINHHVIGDSKYGINEINRKFKANKQLLFAYKYTFCFNNLSYLNYLDGKVIELEKEIYNVSF